MLYGRPGKVEDEEVDRWGGVGGHHHHAPHPNHANEVKGSGAGIAAAIAPTLAIEYSYTKILSSLLCQQFESYMEMEGK